MQSLTARGPFDSIIFYVSEDFCFIPFGSKCEALLLGVHLILLYFIPRRDCESSTECGPIVFTYVLFCVRKRILDFKFTGGFLPFWNLENVLFIGWDGMGWDGWDGMDGWGIKSVLQFSLYFVCI